MSISVSVFLFLFLLAFLPFGVSNYNPKHQYTLQFVAAMGNHMVVTFLTCLINEFLIKPWVVQRVTLLAIIAWFVWIMACLGVSNFLLYNIHGNWHDPSWQSGIDFTLNASSIFIFPIVGTTFYFRYLSLKYRYQEISHPSGQTKESNQLLHFKGQGSADNVAVAKRDFLFGKAQDNYVELVYASNGTITTQLIRSSMNELLQRTKSDFLVRCHRSYFVNIHQVRAVHGGNRISLHLNHIESPIQVSGSYKDEVLAQLS